MPVVTEFFKRVHKTERVSICAYYARVKGASVQEMIIYFEAKDKKENKRAGKFVICKLFASSNFKHFQSTYNISHRDDLNNLKPEISAQHGGTCQFCHTGETEAGGCLSPSVWGQPEQHNKSPFLKTKTKTEFSVYAVVLA